MPSQSLPAVVTIFDLATTASLSTAAVFEAQFTTAGLATTVQVPFSQLATTIWTSFVWHGNSVLGVAGAATAANMPIVAMTSGQVLQLLGTTIVFATLPGPLQRSVLASTTISTADGVLNFTLATAATQSVPLASTRNGIPLIFQDAALNFSTNNLTLNASVGDTFAGATTILMAVDGQRLTLIPFNDGVNAGYSIG